MDVIKRGFKNAFRNSIRSFSIVLILGLSIGLALTMLIARGAVEEKIKSVQGSIGNTISVSPAGMRGFEGGGEPLTEEQASQISALEHVTTAIKTLSDRVTSENSSLTSAIEAGSLGKRFSENSGTPPSDAPTPTQNGTTQTRSFTPPITILGISDAENLESLLSSSSVSLTSGKIFDSNSNENVAIIGAALATKNNLSINSTFTAYEKPITVIGIFDAGNNFSNNQVVLPIKSLQALTDQVGEFTGMTITVDSITNIDSVTQRVEEIFGDAADVVNGSEQAKSTIEPLENIQSISTLSLFGSLIAGSVIILLTMMMIVRERRREIGVLKAIGANNLKVMAQFIVESLTLTLTATVVGVGIGFFASNPVTKLLVQNSISSSQPTQGSGMGRVARGMMSAAGAGIQNIQTNVGWDILLYGLGAALLIAIVGSAIPAWFISKVRPAEVMRAE